MIKEIGSDFWDEGSLKKNKLYLLSGRTALEFIIRDVLKTHSIRIALLPSYCCYTMIEPFLRHSISVEFYDIYATSDGFYAQIPEIRDGTIFYCMTYFGFTKIAGIDIRKIKKSAEVIIEDKTHSWLTEHSFEGADYCYASYRKWTGFDAVATAEKCGEWSEEIPHINNEVYCSMRRKAMEMKKNYIVHGFGDKQHYLDLFAKAEELLEKDYVGYTPKADTIIDFYMFDREKVKEIRRQNAAILIEGLKGISGVQMIFSAMTDDDVPLFLPIIVHNGLRNKLRKYLIENNVYCPIHWSLSELHDINDVSREIYENELSLVCDQRYEAKDMQRIISFIYQFYRSY